MIKKRIPNPATIFVEILIAVFLPEVMAYLTALLKKMP